MRFPTLSGIVWLMVATEVVALVDYCKLKCGNVPHSACGSHCHSRNITRIDPDYIWRVRILKAHNNARHKLASGGFTAGGNGQASNMMSLSYDMDLEFTAACWLYSHGKPDHDACRITPRFSTAGQNIWKDSLVDPRSTQGPKKIIEVWFEGQGSNTDKALIDKFPPKQGRQDDTYGYFTQLVWHSVTHVGCARAKMKKDSRLIGEYLVFCNYGPSGNIEGMPVYQRGKCATKCPGNLQPDASYPCLCGRGVLPKSANYVGVPEIDELHNRIHEAEMGSSSIAFGCRNEESAVGLLLWVVGSFIVVVHRRYFLSI